MKALNEMNKAEQRKAIAADIERFLQDNGRVDVIAPKRIKQLRVVVDNDAIRMNAVENAADRGARYGDWFKVANDDCFALEAVA